MNLPSRDPFLRSRLAMVERLKAQGIQDTRVLEAMARVPRELFVALALRGQAYEDVRLPIGLGQTISQPWTVARMCELLEAPPGTRVLEVGGGSGYHAAVLGEMGAIVFSVERHADLARDAAERIRRLGYLRVNIKHFDGTYGWAAWAPFRAVLVTAAAPEIPDPLVRQLEDGGRMVLPLVRPQDRAQRLVVVTRRGDQVTQEDHGPADFVPLIGKYGFDPADAPS